jgi:Lon protease-like protein
VNDTAAMPMFPLGSVLLPGGLLTLHVFEPRYRAMVQHCVADPDHEFGVVLIERGSEVGGGDQRLGVGTVAQMVQVAETDDGRYAVVAVGTRRIRVDRWIDDAPFPLADVADWDDDMVSGVAEDLIAEVARRVRASAALALELGDPVVDLGEEISADPVVASFQLAALAPIGPADQYRLLCAVGPAERLEMLVAMIDDIEPLLQFRLQRP